MQGYTIGIMVLTLSMPFLGLSISPTTLDNRSSNNNYFNELSESNLIESCCEESIALLPNLILDQTAQGSWKDLLNSTGLAWLHSQGYKGQGVKIGIIDNGVDFTHEAFSNITYTEKSFANYQSLSTETHGTPVMGVITGYASGDVNGTAPEAEVFSAEMGSDPTDAVIFGNFTAAVEWMGENGVSIINTSFGGYFNWTSLIEVAKAYGIILVGSAGNDGSQLPPSGPGADEYSIGVGAISSQNILESYSSVGPTTRYTQKPDVVSYGSVLTTNIFEGVNTYTGTSFSSPTIAGGIASLISALNNNNDTWTIGKIKSALIESAYSVSGSPKGIGAGMVNFTRAFELLTANNQLGTFTPISEIADEFKVIPEGLVQKLPLQVIVSNISTTQIQIEGDIQDILLENTITEFSTTPFDINTSGVMKKIYSGNISIIINGTLVKNHTLSIEVRNEFMGFVGVDYFHNDQYVRGEENLLNSRNEWALTLREMGYWPVYILEEFTDQILENIDILFMKNVFIGDSYIISKEFTSSIISAYELAAIETFRFNGGKLFLSFLSGSSGSSMVEVQKLLDLSDLDVDENSPLIRSDYKLFNVTYITKDTARITFEGYSIEGGVSIMDDVRGLVISDDIFGKMIVTSSDDVFNNPDLLSNIFSWLTMPENYIIREIDDINDPITLIYEGGNYDSDSALLIGRDYNGTITSVNDLVIEDDGGIGLIQIQTSSGISDVLVTSSISDNYLRVSGTQYLELIKDKIRPEIRYIGNSSSLLLNESQGEFVEKIIFEYNDNHEVNVSRTRVNYDRGDLLFQSNENDNTLWFYITAELFEEYDFLNITIELYDMKGNMGFLMIKLTRFRIIEVIPPGLTDRSTVLFPVSEELISINDDIYNQQITQFLLILIVIVAVVSYFKLKEWEQ